ncbi:MAG: hypothetical protein ACXWIU_06510 [Limisphaerales bacterium]
MTRNRPRRILLCLCALVFLGLTAWILNRTYSTKAFRKKAALIQIGDDQARVRLILGKPRDATKISGGGFLVSALTGGYPEWWAYGSIWNDYDWKHPFTGSFPWIIPPIKWHFSPGTNDVAIYFGADGKVARIYIPAN